MSDYDIPYEPQCRDCRADAGKANALTTWVCGAHVRRRLMQAEQERDELRDAVSSTWRTTSTDPQRLCVNLVKAYRADSEDVDEAGGEDPCADVAGRLRRERDKARAEIERIAAAAERTATRLLDAERERATFYEEYRRRFDIETKALHAEIARLTRELGDARAAHERDMEAGGADLYRRVRQAERERDEAQQEVRSCYAALRGEQGITLPDGTAVNVADLQAQVEDGYAAVARCDALRALLTSVLDPHEGGLDACWVETDLGAQWVMAARAALGKEGR